METMEFMLTSAGIDYGGDDSDGSGHNDAGNG